MPSSSTYLFVAIVWNGKEGYTYKRIMSLYRSFGLEWLDYMHGSDPYHQQLLKSAQIHTLNTHRAGKKRKEAVTVR